MKGAGKPSGSYESHSRIPEFHFMPPHSHFDLITPTY